jgi:hypothetical protein
VRYRSGDAQERRDAGHLARLLERLLGRRTDALTNSLANIRIFCATSRIESYSRWQILGERLMVGKVLAAAEAVANVKAEHSLKLSVLDRWAPCLLTRALSYFGIPH